MEAGHCVVDGRFKWRRRQMQYKYKSATYIFGRGTYNQNILKTMPSAGGYLGFDFVHGPRSIINN